MPEFKDYREKQDEYELDENGRYISDVKDPHLNFLICAFVILALMIPLTIIESIWTHYLPTGKVIWTCLILDAVVFIYLRVMLFEDEKDKNDRLVWKPKHRKLK
jgi:hypothetical protein